MGVAFYLRYPLIAAAVLCAGAQPANAYVSFGNGFGSKWGDDAAFGTGAVVTWGFMPDGTGVDPDFRMDPFNFPNDTGLSGTSSVSTLRNRIDVTLGHGAGAFDAAIERAFETWSSAANIRFVQVFSDPGEPFASAGSTTPDIRIGAFVPQAGHSFNNVGAVGFGPRGGPWSTEDGLAGDILFNLGATFDIVAGIEDTTPIPAFTNDLEGLMLHELGHAAIGLGHPDWDGVSNPDQRVMYVGQWNNPAAPPGAQTINRQLHADDIAGARFTYGLAGDTNSDGDIDDSDLGTSFANYTGPVGAAGGKTAQQGDTDFDGDIDDSDLGTSFAGYTGPLSPTTVPEPATLTLLIGGAMFVRRRRRS